MSKASMCPEYKFVGIAVNKFVGLTDYKSVCNVSSMTLGERLKAARKYAKLTQKELEAKSGISQQTISNIEKGQQEKSTDIVPLAMACGVRPEWLAMESGEMADGLYVDNEKIKRAVLLMQEMPEYALDEAIKSIDSVAKLTALAKKAAQ